MRQKEKRTHFVAELLGWYGVAAIVGAYALLSFKYLDAGLTYQLLNITGASSIIISSIYKKDYQPVVINGFIAVFAAITLIRLLVF